MKKSVIFIWLLGNMLFITSCAGIENNHVHDNEYSTNAENTAFNIKEEETLKLSQKAVHYSTGLSISKEKSEALRDMWLQDLSEEECKRVEKLIFEVHSYLESNLIYRFKGDCSPNSAVWIHIDDDPDDNVISGYTGIDMINDLKQSEQIINKVSFSAIAQKIINQLEIVIATHDIDLLYEIHQEVHDLSYWAINYPIENLKIAPADWNGVYIYFGTLDNITEE